MSSKPPEKLYTFKYDYFSKIFWLLLLTFNLLHQPFKIIFCDSEHMSKILVYHSYTNELQAIKCQL